MLPPIGFLSYARQDDEQSNGQITALHRALSNEFDIATGTEILLWQDKEKLTAGRIWEESIRTTIKDATFFIPVLSPRFFNQEYCNRELTLFKARQKALGRRDLIFPLEFVSVRNLADSDVKYPRALLALRKIQMSEFSELRGLDFKSKPVQDYLKAFVQLILTTLRTPAGTASETAAAGDTARDAAPLAAKPRKEKRAASPRAAKSANHPVLSRFVPLPPQDIAMGNDEYGRFRCTLTRPIKVDPTPVTQAFYESIMGHNPSSAKGANWPVVNVNWLDVVRFCNTLSQAHGLDRVYAETSKNANSVQADLTRNGFRLPTECEWECFAGAGVPSSGRLEDYAWFIANANGRPHDVATKMANERGLFDTLGNVSEWCGDWFDKYPAGEMRDWSGPGAGAYRVVRGGSWASFRANVHAKHRDRFDPSTRDNNIGFRLVVTATD